MDEVSTPCKCTGFRPASLAEQGAAVKLSSDSRVMGTGPSDIYTTKGASFEQGEMVEGVKESENDAERQEHVELGAGGNGHQQRDAGVSRGLSEPDAQVALADPRVVKIEAIQESIEWLQEKATKERESAQARLQSADVWESGDDASWSEGAAMASRQTGREIKSSTAAERKFCAEGDRRISAKHAASAAKYEQAIGLLTELTASIQREKGTT